jgi:hypothetical protein
MREILRPGAHGLGLRARVIRGGEQVALGEDELFDGRHPLPGAFHERCGGRGEGRGREGAATSAARSVRFMFIPFGFN